MNSAGQKVNLFILGAPKCGTTSLAHYLKQHPRVFASEIKEPHYFNTDSAHRYYHSLEEYEKLFTDAPSEAEYLMEGSVWYLYSKAAVNNILEYNPDSKFVIMLRNPVDMYFSLHRELLFGGAEAIRSPMEAWHAQEDRLAGKRIPKGAYEPSLLIYGEACKLGKQMKRAMDHISKEKLFYIFLDDLKENPDKIFLELQDFLGIEAYSLDSYDTINAKKQRKSALLHKTIIHINYLKKKLGINVGMGLSKKINERNITAETEDISIDIQTLKPELLSYFSEDIALLESLTNRDLSNWKE